MLNKFVCALLILIVLPVQQVERPEDTNPPGKSSARAQKRDQNPVKPAKIVWMGSEALVIEYEIPKGFRKGDQLLVLRSTDKDIVVVGQAKVVDIREGETWIWMTNNLLGIRMEDFVYVTNRTNSPYSIAKAHFIRENDTAKIPSQP
jgi:hypothetical protein